MSRWLEIYRAISTTGVMIVDGIPMETQSRRQRSVEMAKVSSDPVLFPVGLLYGAGRLQGEGPLEEQCEPRISSLT